jgi:hypothetical protein
VFELDRTWHLSPVLRVKLAIEGEKVPEGEKTRGGEVEGEKICGGVVEREDVCEIAEGETRPGCSWARWMGRLGVLEVA